ncbi:MAG: HAD hydrolase-like protein, partial [Collinsella intestinalis]|nr:HAD hydrolase-like protein [Collinsella intestinalis]
MTYTHVIFDLDGTLLNTLEDLTIAGNHVCESRGWPTYTADQFRYKVGNGQIKLIERLIPAEFMGNGRVFEQALADFRAFYAEHKEDHTAPYPGILELLDELRERGVTCAVLSNKDHAATVPLVERYFGDRVALA